MTPETREGGDVMYPDTLRRLEDLLTGDDAPWSGVEVTRHLYPKPPLVDYTGVDDIVGKNEQDTKDKRREEQRDREEAVLRHYYANPPVGRGRAMVENAPKQTIDYEDAFNTDLRDPPVAIYRVLMENDIHVETWCPHDNQREGNNQKRAACDLPSKSSTATDSSTGTPTGSTTGLDRITTTAATTTSPMCEIATYGTYSICSCSSTNGGHTVSHAIRKPSATDCSDIKTFPMTSFMQVATAVPTSLMCVNTQKD
ncbi:hypothetical protein PENSTE_c027G02544 [Penicillium steckii]|uniref:Uncharacterized protein n=1 Tax=Penicillium steckii TaxID=303698 RepID=A0A1V6SNV6_9EURO|nr:hypothetical protein PENSTE_c027G02544 [Penicillium steckii]